MLTWIKEVKWAIKNTDLDEINGRIFNLGNWITLRKGLAQRKACRGIKTISQQELSDTNKSFKGIYRLILILFSKQRAWNETIYLCTCVRLRRKMRNSSQWGYLMTLHLSKCKDDLYCRRISVLYYLIPNLVYE